MVNCNTLPYRIVKTIRFLILSCMVLYITQSAGCLSEMCPVLELIQCQSFNIPHVAYSTIQFRSLRSTVVESVFCFKLLTHSKINASNLIALKSKKITTYKLYLYFMDCDGVTQWFADSSLRGQLHRCTL